MMATVASPEPALERPAPDYVFEPELMLPTPRRVPKAFRRGGRWARRREITIAVTCWAALAMMGTQFTYIQQIGHYFVPLAHLDWIGLGLLLLALGIWLSTNWLGSEVRMFRRGEPLAVRVIELGQSMRSMHGAQLLQLTAAVAFEHPMTGQLMQAQVASQELGLGIGKKAADYSLDLKPGDTVTALIRNKAPEKNLRLYGLMGVNPLVDYVLFKGKRIDAQRIRQELRLFYCVAPLFLLLMLSLPFSNARTPLEDGPVYWLVAGAIMLATASPLFWLTHRELMKYSLFGRWFVRLGILAMGAVMAWVAIPVLNAAATRGTADYQQFIVEQFRETTREGILRSYSVNGANLTTGKPFHHDLLFEDIRAAGSLYSGLLDIRTGLLGLPYIHKVEPLMCNVELDKAPTTDVLMTSGTTPGGRRFYVTVVPLNIDVDAGPMQPALVDHVRTKLIEGGGMYEVTQYATELERETTKGAGDAAP